MGRAMKRRQLIAVLLMVGGLTLIGFPGAAAWAFASPDANGHENITRAALSCSASMPVPFCFQDANRVVGASSMAQLAGQGRFVGGVDAPDHGGLLDIQAHPAAHCLNGDYNIVGASDYRQTEAEAHASLRKCVLEVFSRMTKAVGRAAELLRHLAARRRSVTASRRAVTIPVGGCKYFGGISGKTPIVPSNAKCAVLIELGRGMHTAQDFFSHSNWADHHDPIFRPLHDKFASSNIPGLAEGADLPGFFSFTCTPTACHSPVQKPGFAFPNKLVTACGFSEGNRSCIVRTAITHGSLSKDCGVINPVTGVATDPCSARGKISYGINGAFHTNFQWAVTGAIKQTRQLWSDFIAALRARYGPADSALMVRALTCDKPWEPATCPSGAVGAGGGSTAGVADPALIAAGAAAVLAGLLLLGSARWRRRSASHS